MKKLIYFFLVSVLAICVASCTNEMPENLYPESPANASNSLISVEDAIAYSNQLFKLKYGTQTRSSEIESVEYISTTKSSDTMYGFYAINYGENNGFALVSADSRRPDIVYGISDSGSLTQSDIDSNENLSWYVNEYLPGVAQPLDTPSIP